MAERTCSFPGCDKPHKARGWCQTHYRFWRLYGDPGKRLRIRNTGTPEERWWARVNKNGPIPEHRPDLGPCWLWTGQVGWQGYGKFSNEHGKSIHAHNWGYRRFVGPIPEGLVPDHLCRVTSCVKVLPDEHGPAHLEPVTQLVNVHRSRATKWLGVTCADPGCQRQAESLGLCKKHHETLTRKRKPCKRCGGPKGPGERRQLCDFCRLRN